MITDCNLYSQKKHMYWEKKNIFINGYQLKHALHVAHLFYWLFEYDIQI